MHMNQSEEQNRHTGTCLQVAALETTDCQNGVHRADPCVLVWSSETMQEQRRLFHGRGMRGVSCVQFSSSGRTLVSVCTDNSHTMFVWHWERGQCLLSRKTRAGAAPDVCGVSWSPFAADQLCTFGNNHVFFWKLLRKPEEESVKVRCIEFGGRMQLQSCATRLQTWNNASHC